GGPRGKALRKSSTNLSKILGAMCEAAKTYAPSLSVTYKRLDCLHNAWNAFDMIGCQESFGKRCPCKRCVTMDILTITHIVEARYCTAQLQLLVQYIQKVCGDDPWALASLMPGKSNFWLCGCLVDMIPMEATQPSCLYVTRVNDSKPWEDYPW